MLMLSPLSRCNLHCALSSHREKRQMMCKSQINTCIRAVHTVGSAVRLADIWNGAVLLEEGTEQVHAA